MASKSFDTDAERLTTPHPEEPPTATQLWCDRRAARCALRCWKFAHDRHAAHERRYNASDDNGHDEVAAYSVDYSSMLAEKSRASTLGRKLRPGPEDAVLVLRLDGSLFVLLPDDDYEDQSQRIVRVEETSIVPLDEADDPADPTPRQPTLPPGWKWFAEVIEKLGEQEATRRLLWCPAARPTIEVVHDEEEAP